MKDDILSLWHAHRQAPLPDVPREGMGELWVLDEVIGGCVKFYLQAGGGLGALRRVIVEGCWGELARVRPYLWGTSACYFWRVEALAGLVVPAYGVGGESSGGGP